VSARIVSPYARLAALLEEERGQGRSVALANGCFDLLHVGHVRLLRAARELADTLVVALNSDTSARSNKGPGRPLVPLLERMELVAAVEGVDFVTSFEEPSAAALLEALRPDVQVKGTDWSEESVPEGDIVRAYGGRVAIAGDPKTHSSSELAQRLQRARS
jgi:rfaE bifunctional protein nucleotidyltransferase chain/domain